MRRAIYWTLTHRIPCGIVCSIVMIAVMEALAEFVHWLYREHGALPFIPLFACIWYVAYRQDIAEQKRLGIKRPLFRWQWLIFRD